MCVRCIFTFVWFEYYTASTWLVNSERDIYSDDNRRLCWAFAYLNQDVETDEIISVVVGGAKLRFLVILKSFIEMERMSGILSILFTVFLGTFEYMVIERKMPMLRDFFGLFIYKRYPLPFSLLLLLFLFCFVFVKCSYDSTNEHRCNNLRHFYRRIPFWFQI